MAKKELESRETETLIRLDNVLHREPNTVKVVVDCFERLKKGGKLLITVPYGNFQWHDPYCVKQITVECLSAFDKCSEVETPCKFQYVKVAVCGTTLHVEMFK